MTVMLPFRLIKRPSGRQLGPSLFPPTTPRQPPPSDALEHNSTNRTADWRGLVFAAKKVWLRPGKCHRGSVLIIQGRVGFGARFRPILGQEHCTGCHSIEELGVLAGPIFEEILTWPVASHVGSYTRYGLERQINTFQKLT